MIRFKGTVFHLFNFVRSILRGDFVQAFKKLAKAFSFFFKNPSYLKVLEEMKELEKKRGLRSRFHIYSSHPSGSALKNKLFDPGYKVTQNSKLIALLKTYKSEGWDIGLHPSFSSWKSFSILSSEKETLENALGFNITQSRQHWLRFSVIQTWSHLSKAGIKTDSTLGFNDRPSFRNSSALSYCPWSFESDSAMDIQAMPLILMDSHFYDYFPMSDEERKSQLNYWISEIRAVGGEATVLWHSHTLAADYGWKQGFIELLDLVSDSNRKFN